MKRSNIIGLIGALLGVAVVVSILSWFVIQPTPTILQGETDATSYKASSKVAGRIDSMMVREGQRVRKGDLLYVLSTPEVDAKVAQARAAQAAAAAQELKANRGARSQDIQSARDLYTQAESALALAQKNYERAVNLQREGVIATQRLDEATTNLQVTQAAADAARQQYSLALEGARSEDKSAAIALTQQAAAVVAEAVSLQSDQRIFSPADGEVSSVIAEVGELVGQGYPVVTVIDMNDIWVTYNIKETLMPKIKIGLRFVAYVPALDRDVEFVVDHIASQADFATWSATRTQGGFDIRTFAVKTRPTSYVEDLRPGMSALVNWDEL
ncbi:MAG: HlyD family efflux transporter periplasmic adaptor subunit [Rikenellaceae bacterium]|nr:HlyD family efflux transporter periplasmic adaptor subunit [Rikenellaceae bacterium]